MPAGHPQTPQAPQLLAWRVQHSAVHWWVGRLGSRVPDRGCRWLQGQERRGLRPAGRRHPVGPRRWRQQGHGWPTGLP